jgi:predicted GNAT superfamily acetyltransferase
MMIRDTTGSDFAAILQLNLESERFLSPLNLERLEKLHGQAAFHRVACIGEEVVAFLLAFREGADYDSPNYRWFAARYAAFLYIDRIVVAAAHQGKQLGAELYRNLFQFARETGIGSITCEFDIVPPNEASRRFHARFGFREVGVQWVADGKKQVSLQEATA